MGSIYSGLGVRQKGPEVYRGTWNGHSVAFERVFRGYRFSDEECEALLNGEMLEVHGLRRGDVVYSVTGSLAQSKFAMLTGPGYNIVRFIPDRTISYNPDYDFKTRNVVMLNKSAAQDAQTPSEPENDVQERLSKPPSDGRLWIASSQEDEQNGAVRPSDVEVEFTLDETDDTLKEVTSMNDALLSQDETETLLRISDSSELAVYVPILSTLSESEKEYLRKKAIEDNEARKAAQDKA